MKKVLSMILISIMLLGLVASVSAVAEGNYKERVVIAYSDTLRKIDPQSNNTGVNGHIYELTHNTLVTCDYTTNEIIPELAASWEVDGLTYTFHLRDDVTFHDGQKFTAEDVKFTYERAAATSYQAPKVADIASIEVVDDVTVKITLSKPNAEFLDLLCVPNMSILCHETVGAWDPAAAEEDQGTKNGTGAFHLTEWVPGEYCVVTRNDNYFEGVVPTKEIKYVKYSEASARVIALQTGEVDICMDIPAIEINYIAEDSHCVAEIIPGTKLIYMAMNVNGFSDKLLDANVRKAIQHSINTEEVIIAMTEAYATPANGCIPSNIYGYSDAVQTYEYDIEKAKALLAEAGYADGLEISFSYNAAIYPGLFELLQGQLAKAGITLTLSTDDNTILGDQTGAGEYELTIAQWSFSTIDNSLRSLWYTGSGSNRTLTADATLDGMLDAAVSETDSAKRLELYAEISQYLVDGAAMCPLYVDTLLYGVRDNVSGYTFNSNIRHDFKWIAVTE